MDHTEPSAAQMIFSLIVFGIMMLVGAAFCFMPFIVALMKRHHQKWMIFILNFFLGWTFVAWVVALALAFSATGAENKGQRGVID